MRARPEESLLPNPFARIHAFWSAQSRTRRDLLALALAVVFGLIVLPWLIWIAGIVILGPYAGGSIWRFIGDFFAALAHGDLAFWLIVLGPAAFLVVARLMWVALRARAG
jgi:hypothetical protein